MNRKPVLFLAIILSIVAFGQSAPDWKLVWSDDFDARSGAPPDSAKWVFDLGGNGWGNKELQVYTNKPENVFHNGAGQLVIRAIKTADGGYTSARLKTHGKFDVKYGRIAARIKVPHGQGIWPAFWMLGSDLGKTGWPRCGEIDIMENIGKEPAIAHGTLHGPGYSGGKAIGKPFELGKGARFADDFHVFEAVWEPRRITFLVDGKQYHEVTPETLPAGATWAFDHPFFMLLNLAVGGLWPGYPDATTTFPQEMMVDWVRVWQR